VHLIEIPEPKASDPLVCQVYDAILRPSFDADELPSVGAVTGGVGGRAHRLLVVAVDDEVPIGAALYTEDGTGVGKLDYLAARPDGRSRGVGSALMGRLASVWSDRAIVAVLGEVHDPRFHVEGPGEQAVAMLRFCQRNGARLLDIPWVQPRLSPAGARVHHMLLVDLLAGSERALPSATRGRWIEGYYLAAEGAVPTDPTFRALRARVFAHDPVGFGAVENPQVEPLDLSGVDP
jgi:GNAT superfamily N-acetyltransferase